MVQTLLWRSDNFLLCSVCGVEELVPRRAHNPEVAGAEPVTATNENKPRHPPWRGLFASTLTSMTLLDSLGPTRSSWKWSEMPGNFDVLNTRALFKSSNQWGIPDLPATMEIPDHLLAYNDRWSCANPPDNACVHFFLDDYRFETLWTNPTRPITRLQRVGTALTPDFSMWSQMPKIMQLWQVYRARWCGAWMIQHGVKVIPTVGWSTPESWEFCFAGLPKWATVAVSAVGVVRRKEAQGAFASGLKEMVDQLEPAKILVYGKLPDIVDRDYYGDLFKFYPTRWR